MNPDNLAGRVYRHGTIGLLALMTFLGFQLIYGRLASLPGNWATGGVGLYLDRLLYALLFCGLGWVWFARILPWFFLLTAGIVAPENRRSFWIGPHPARGLLFGILGGGLLLGLMFLFDLWRGAGAVESVPGRQTMRAALESSGGLILYLPLSGLITPILEEIFFRGLLVGFLRRQELRPWFALALPALCFAAVHPLATFPLLLGIGLILGVLFWRYGLASAVVAHSIYNAGILLYTFLATPASQG